MQCTVNVQALILERKTCNLVSSKTKSQADTCNAFEVLDLVSIANWQVRQHDEPQSLMSQMSHLQYNEKMILEILALSEA